MCTYNSKGLLHAIYEASEEHHLPKAVLLRRTGQEVCDQDETQFHSGRVKVRLQEVQKPIAAQGIIDSILLT